MSLSDPIGDMIARVKNAQSAFDFFKEHNFRIIDDAPRPGSRGTTVFFIHPKSNDVSPLGVLYEVVEDPEDVNWFCILIH